MHHCESMMVVAYDEAMAETIKCALDTGHKGMHTGWSRETQQEVFWD